MLTTIASAVVPSDVQFRAQTLELLPSFAYDDVLEKIIFRSNKELENFRGVHMLDASLIGRTASALAVLALPFLNGCASRSDVATTNDFEGGYAGTVSAREYGYVRPADDVSVAARNRGFKRSAGGDLWGRVRSGMQLNLHADSRIDSSLNRYQRDPRYLDKMTERAAPYLPAIVAEIERRGLPMELALLPHVESRYNPEATSPKAAAGIWQFMPYTAREMGLRLDSGYDGRRDVVASTRAAMDYLEQLRDRFNGDWELAMAAYNCGPGRVESALAANRRSGRQTDFWSLDLPNETQQYVPQILAAARLVAESRRGGGRSFPSTPLRPQLEVIHSSEPMDLVGLATASGVDLIQLQRLNPGVEMRGFGAGRIDRLMVPAGVGERLSARSDKIRVMPMSAASQSASSRVAVRLYERQPGLSDRGTEGKAHTVKNGDTLASVALRHGIDLKTLADWNGMSAYDPLLPGQTLQIPKRAASAPVTHRVRKGDSIGTIARRYGVTIGDIQRWNHIADSGVNPGETLRIYRHNAGSST
jgi:membrane-bound lytic murein transglycosylase D